MVEQGAEAMWNTTNISAKVDWYGIDGLKLGLAGYFGDTNVDVNSNVPVLISMLGLDAR